MTKIVITANITWALYNFRRNLIQSLLDNGFKVILVCTIDKYTSYFESIGCEIVDLKLDSKSLNPIKDIYTFFSIIKILSSIKPDFILNFSPKNNIYSTLAANFTKAKVVNNIAGLGVVFIENNLVSNVTRFLYKISQTRANKIFFQNEDDRALFLKSKICDESKIDQLPGSGVDLARFNPVEAPDDGKVRFIIIARMLWDKGIGHYADAARILKQKYGDSVEFRMLGFLDFANPSAVTKQQMSEWVDEGIVNYLGTSDNVESEIGNNDCVVLPSFYREGVPRSLLEAAAMAKPIVTTDSVGCRETVDEGINGYLCIHKSTESLVKNLEKIINLSHEERVSMGNNSRRKIEVEFDEKIVIQKYLDFIEKG